MKRIFIVLLVFSVTVLVFLFAYDYRSKQEHSFSAYTLSDDELLLLHDGDIILRHGYGMVSDMISSTMKEKFSVSHCAFVNKPDSGSIRVIHSVSQSLSDFDGVQDQGIRKFIRDSKPNSVIVIRYKGASAEEAAKISQAARHYLDRKIAFDHSFNLKDTSTFYCTELLWRVFLDVFDDDIFIGPGAITYDHLRFQAFWDTTRFEIIINHHETKPYQIEMQ